MTGAPLVNVPCGTCSACCRNDRIVLRPEHGDDPATYRCHDEGGHAVLDRKPNGECTYLGAEGCSIHERAPLVCRAFDCRLLFLATPKAQRRIRIVQNPSMRDVYSAARTRLDTLDPTVLAYAKTLADDEEKQHA